MTSKYHNVKVTADGYTFDSKRERDRYLQLALMERGNEIEKLELQPRFNIAVNGSQVCAYVADFRYLDRRTGETVVEDVKSDFTRKNPVYRLKNKLMRAVHGIEIVEV